MPRHLIGDAHGRMNEISHWAVLLYALTTPHPRDGAWDDQGGTLLSLTLVRQCEVTSDGCEWGGCQCCGVVVGVCVCVWCVREEWNSNYSHELLLCAANNCQVESL